MSLNVRLDDVTDGTKMRPNRLTAKGRCRPYADWQHTVDVLHFPVRSSGAPCRQWVTAAPRESSRHGYPRTILRCRDSWCVGESLRRLCAGRFLPRSKSDLQPPGPRRKPLRCFSSCARLPPNYSDSRRYVLTEFGMQISWLAQGGRASRHGTSGLNQSDYQRSNELLPEFGRGELPDDQRTRTCGDR